MNEAASAQSDREALLETIGVAPAAWPANCLLPPPREDQVLTEKRRAPHAHLRMSPRPQYHPPAFALNPSRLSRLGRVLRRPDGLLGVRVAR